MVDTEILTGHRQVVSLKESVMGKAKKVVEDKAKVEPMKPVKDAKALYEARQAFVAKHGKTIAAEFAKPGHGNQLAIIRATKLNDVMVAYSLKTLGLAETKDSRVLNLLKADKEFQKERKAK